MSNKPPKVTVSFIGGGFRGVARGASSAVEFSVDQARYCCGVSEMGGFGVYGPDAQHAASRTLAYALRHHHTNSGIFATTVSGQEVWATALAEAGFQKVSAYRNRNTGATVTFWFRTKTQPKKKEKVEKA